LAVRHRLHVVIRTQQVAGVLTPAALVVGDQHLLAGRGHGSFSSRGPSMRARNSSYPGTISRAGGSGSGSAATATSTRGRRSTTTVPAGYRPTGSVELER